MANENKQFLPEGDFMFKKFGEFYKIDNGGKPGVSKSPVKTEESDKPVNPSAAGAYRVFLARHREISRRIDQRENEKKKSVDF